MSHVLVAFEEHLPTALAAGLTASAAWLMKKLLVGLLVGIGRMFAALIRILWNAIKWKIGWY